MSKRGGIIRKNRLSDGQYIQREGEGTSAEARGCMVVHSLRLSSLVAFWTGMRSPWERETWEEVLTRICTSWRSKYVS
jgi:hypothetical protein